MISKLRTRQTERKTYGREDGRGYVKRATRKLTSLDSLGASRDDSYRLINKRGVVWWQEAAGNIARMRIELGRYIYYPIDKGVRGKRKYIVANSGNGCS